MSLEDKTVINNSVIYFEHEALDELYGELIRKGVAFEQASTDQRYLWKEAILKTSGNTIKLYWAGENRLNPPWKIEKRL